MFGAAIGEDQAIDTSIAKFVTIPIDLLCSDSIARSILCMLDVIAVDELGPAVAAPFVAVQGGARLQDGPEMLEGDDFVLDVVKPGCDDIFELGFEDFVQELEMAFGFSFFLFFESSGQLGPAVYERVEGGLEDESLESWSNT